MSVPNFADLEFEDDEKNPMQIMQEMKQIDAEMKRIRFAPDISNEEKIDTISELMLSRNKLYDQLQAQKAKEFKEFIATLKLIELEVQPFYPVPRRCKLLVQNEEATQLVNEKVEETPWQKLFSSYVKKKENKRKKSTQKALNGFAAERNRILEGKRDRAQEHLHRLANQHSLSVSELAEKFRLQTEVEECERAIITSK